MIKIGLLSDTHGFLDPKIFEHFQDRDELWHAGDIGSTELADALDKFKPLRAVYGNIDDIRLQTKYPEDQFFTCEQLTVLMTHIGGVPPAYNPRVKKMLKANTPDLFICGHSHILRIKRDPNLNNMLYLNPGAAGNQGFHAMKTIVRFTINEAKIENMEVIELGKRGAIEAN
jgi:putative phosphoesterase